MVDDPIKIKQALDAMKNRERLQVKTQMERLKNPTVINVDSQINITGKIDGKTNEAALMEKRVIRKSLKKERKKKDRREGEESDQNENEESEEEDEDEDQDEEEENDKDEEEKKDDEDENEDDEKDEDKDDGDEKEKEDDAENEGEKEREGDGEKEQPESEQDVADKFHEGQNLERGAAKGAGEGAAAGGEGAAGAAGAAAGEGAAAGAAGAGGAAAAEGGAAAGGALMANPYFWLVVAIIIGILLIIGLIFSVPGIIKGMCESGGVTGTVTKVVNWTQSIFSGYDVCKELGFDVGNGGQSGGGGAGASFGKTSDSAARAYLAQNGITVNHPQPQTSLEAIEMPTLDEIIRFKQECDKWVSSRGGGTCPVQLTGGTESGHAAGMCSHANGYKFDMNINDPITPFIITSTYKNENNQDVKMFDYRGKRGGDNADLFVFSLTGAVYAREGDHWDVVVNCGTSIPN